MRQYSVAVRAYIAVAIALDGLSSHQEFEEAYQRAEEVRLEFEHARADLNQHMQEHGC